MTKATAKKLAAEIKKRFAADVEVEQIDPKGRFRFNVASPRFEKMPHLKRQDLLWDVVDEVLSRQDTIDISLILAYAPSELATS
jgi:hypothetical protein